MRKLIATIAFTGFAVIGLSDASAAKIIRVHDGCATRCAEEHFIPAAPACCSG